MDSSPPRIALLAGLAVVGVAVLWVAIDAAGRDVAVAVAAAAIAVLVASYVRRGLVAVRSFGDEDACESLRRMALAHVRIMLATPLVLIAAHPWGPATVVAAFGVVGVCHFLFFYTMIVAGLILQLDLRASIGNRYI
jgi:hypothetical protein